jgi:hypothetical protein
MSRPVFGIGSQLREKADTGIFAHHASKLGSLARHRITLSMPV